MFRFCYRGQISILFCRKFTWQQGFWVLVLRAGYFSLWPYGPTMLGTGLTGQLFLLMALEAQVFMMFATGGKHLWPISYGPYGQQHKYLGEKIAEKSSRKKLWTVGASLCFWPCGAAIFSADIRVNYSFRELILRIASRVSKLTPGKRPLLSIFGSIFTRNCACIFPSRSSWNARIFTRELFCTFTFSEWYGRRFWIPGRVQSSGPYPLNGCH